MLDIIALMNRKIVVLTIIAIVIVISLMQILFIWKVRLTLPKAFVITMAIICMVIFGVSIIAFIYFLTFGYNSP